MGELDEPSIFKVTKEKNASLEFTKATEVSWVEGLVKPRPWRRILEFPRG